LHSLDQFLVEPLGAERRAAIPLQQLQAVPLEAAANAALAVPPLVMEPFGQLGQRDEALSHQ
jgi:hypothetical protein